jgi:hypothetical protein
MSGKLISASVAFCVLGSVAIALTVTPSNFSTSERAYPTKADFDWIFGQFATASTFDTESVAANREKLRMAGLKQMNFEEFVKR